MIADARKKSHPSFREFTVIGAIAACVDHLEVGQSVVIERAIDRTGAQVSRRSFRAQIAAVGKKMGHRKFSSTNLPGDSAVAIFRLA